MKEEMDHDDSPLHDKDAMEENIQWFLDGYGFEDDAEKIAKERGCTIVYPKSNQLQIDLDSDEQLENFKRRFFEFRQLWNDHEIEASVEIYQSRSGENHYHIIVDLNQGDCASVEQSIVPYELEETERIMLQFALGSDPIRETLNTMRHICGIKGATRLFKPENAKVCNKSILAYRRK